jgi:hypothetical protein
MRCARAKGASRPHGESAVDQLTALERVRAGETDLPIDHPKAD